jgi:hypothetical protein
VTTTDAWGNVLHVLTLDNPHKEIAIRASGIVDIAEDSEESDGRGAAVAAGFCAVRR